MIKNKFQEAFRVLARAEQAMPQPAGGWGSVADRPTFREELSDAVRRLKEGVASADGAPAEDPTQWV
jgi:hypothetical protein